MIRRNIFQSLSRWSSSTSSSSSSCSSTSVLTQTFQILQENYQAKPYKVDISQNIKWICRCGQSKKYPLCDGSHKSYNNGNITPFKADISEIQKDMVSVCGCGHSQAVLSGKPFCDGTHRKLTK